MRSLWLIHSFSMEIFGDLVQIRVPNLSILDEEPSNNLENWFIIN